MHIFDLIILFYLLIIKWQEFQKEECQTKEEDYQKEEQPEEE